MPSGREWAEARVLHFDKRGDITTDIFVFAAKSLPSEDKVRMHYIALNGTEPPRDGKMPSIVVLTFREARRANRLEVDVVERSLGGTKYAEPSPLRRIFAHS